MMWCEILRWVLHQVQIERVCFLLEVLELEEPLKILQEAWDRVNTKVLGEAEATTIRTIWWMQLLIRLYQLEAEEWCLWMKKGHRRRTKLRMRITWQTIQFQIWHSRVGPSKIMEMNFHQLIKEEEVWTGLEYFCQKLIILEPVFKLLIVLKVEIKEELQKSKKLLKNPATTKNSKLDQLVAQVLVVQTLQISHTMNHQSKNEHQEEESVEF